MNEATHDILLLLLDEEQFGGEYFNMIIEAIEARDPNRVKELMSRTPFSWVHEITENVVLNDDIEGLRLLHSIGYLSQSPSHIHSASDPVADELIRLNGIGLYRNDLQIPNFLELLRIIQTQDINRIRNLNFPQLSRDDRQYLFEAAIQLGNVELLKILMEKYELPANPEELVMIARETMPETIQDRHGQQISIHPILGPLMQVRNYEEYFVGTFVDAAYRGDIEYMKELLYHGDNVDFYLDKFTYDDLVSKGNVEIIKLIHQNITIGDLIDGETLEMAVRSNNIQMVKFIIGNLTEKNITLGVPMAIQQAENMELNDILDYLEGILKREITNAAYVGDEEFFRELVSSGIGFEIDKSIVNTIILFGNEDIFKLLEPYLDDVDSFDKHSLLEAVKSENPEMVKLVLPHTREGINEARQYASEHGLTEISQLLDPTFERAMRRANMMTRHVLPESVIQRSAEEDRQYLEDLYRKGELSASQLIRPSLEEMFEEEMFEEEQSLVEPSFEQELSRYSQPAIIGEGGARLQTLQLPSQPPTQTLQLQPPRVRVTFTQPQRVGIVPPPVTQQVIAPTQPTVEQIPIARQPRRMLTMM